MQPTRLSLSLEVLMKANQAGNNGCFFRLRVCFIFAAWLGLSYLTEVIF
jgi:hypothetical protein